MNTYSITSPDDHLKEQIQQRIDNLNKPLGALGRLEEIALQIGLIQQTYSPTLQHPCHVLFAADHGIEREGVSASPREITWQQMINFTRGGDSHVGGHVPLPTQARTQSESAITEHLATKESKSWIKRITMLL